MPFQGNGTFARVYRWQTDAANGLDIAADRFDAEDDGFATGLSNTLTRDGQSPPTAAIPWGNQNLTGINQLTGASYSFSGNGAIGGTLAVTGNATIGGFLTVTGNTHVAYGSTVKDAGATDRLIGMLEMPPTASTAGRVITLADSGFAVVATGNMTIPTDAVTGFPLGTMVGIYNDSGGAISIAAVTPGTTTLRLGGSAATGARTLASGGMVILWKKAANYWVALNGGVS